jgi:hypothetical protein
MSWPPVDRSEAEKDVVPRLRMSGLPMQQPQPHPDQQQSKYLQSSNAKRPNLPPLSTLVPSSSSFTAAIPSPSIKLSSPPLRRGWSPMSSLNAPPSDDPSRAWPTADTLPHRGTNTGDSLHNLYPPSHPYRHQSRHREHDDAATAPASTADDRYLPNAPLRRSNSISTIIPSRSPAAAPSANRLSLSSLSVQTNRLQSPTSSSNKYYGSDMVPPRLPKTASPSPLSPPPNAFISSVDSSYRPRRERSPASSTTSSSMYPTTAGGSVSSRRRWTGDSSASSSSSRPYDRPRSPIDHEYFGHVWNLYNHVCRVNDGDSHQTRHTYPAIRNGDIKTLLYYLNRELDHLDARDPRYSHELAREADLINRRYKPAASSSSSFLPRRPTHDVSPPSRGSLRHRDEMERAPHHDDMGMGYHAAPHLSGQGGMPGDGLYGGRNTGPSSSSSYLHQHRPLHDRSPLYSPAMTGQTYQSTTPPLHSKASSSSTMTSNSIENSTGATGLPPKRVRKRRDEADQSCLSCLATETPEWRKGPTGPRTLCNACGLLFAKQCRKREMDAQARGERPRGSRPLAPEVMTAAEKERSLMELKIAVNTRSNLSPV